MSYSLIFTGLSIFAGMLLLTFIIGILRISKDNYIALTLFSSLALYCFGYAFELQSFPLQITLQIIGVEYIGIALAPVSVFILVLRYSGVQSQTIKRVLPSLLLIPILSLILIWTPFIIPWFYEQAWMNTNSVLPGFEMKPGIWWFVISTWNASLLSACLVILAKKLVSNDENNRTLLILMFIGISAPLLSIFLNLYLRSSIPIDTTPFSLVITGITLFPTINKYNLLNIIPVAYATVFNTLGSGLIVLDNQGRIRDINKAAEDIFQVTKSGIIGKEVDVYLPMGDHLRNLTLNSPGKREEITISLSGRSEYYLVDLIPFDEGKKNKTGSVLMLTRISEWKEKEEKLIEYTGIIEARNLEINVAYKELKKNQSALKESEQSLKKAQAMAGLGIYEWNLSSHQIFVSEEFSKIFGLDSTGLIPLISDLLKFIRPSDYEVVSTSFESLLESGTPFIIEFWIERNDGIERAVRGQGEVELDQLHNIKHVTFIIQDITERKRMEEELLEASIEKEILLKEIHHRVKNNMQVISSLLSMQSRSIQDPKIQELFKETQARVKSLALVHEQLYKSTNLNKINYRIYIQKIINYFLQSHVIARGTITCNLDCPDIELTIEKAVPCSLIISELLTNTIKHAFPDDQRGEIWIHFSFNPELNWYTLDYRDNGIGIHHESKQGKESGIGSTLITGLTRQLSGGMSVENVETGVHYCLTFPGEKTPICKLKT